MDPNQGTSQHPSAPQLRVACRRVSRQAKHKTTAFSLPSLLFVAPYVTSNVAQAHGSRSRASATREVLPFDGKYSDVALRAAHPLSLQEAEGKEVLNGLLDF